MVFAWPGLEGGCGRRWERTDSPGIVEVSVPAGELPLGRLSGWSRGLPSDLNHMASGPSHPKNPSQHDGSLVWYRNNDTLWL